jgi:hypothetical protein
MAKLLLKPGSVNHERVTSTYSPPLGGDFLRADSPKAVQALG